MRSSQLSPIHHATLNPTWTRMLQIGYQHALKCPRNLIMMMRLMMMIVLKPSLQMFRNLLKLTISTFCQLQTVIQNLQIQKQVRILNFDFSSYVWHICYSVVNIHNT